MKTLNPTLSTLPSVHYLYNWTAFVFDVGIFMDKKRCCTCKEVKPLSEFYRDKSQSGGFKYKCKVCFSKSFSEYCHTKLGLVSRIYGSQKGNSKKRGNNFPNYTKAELKKWLFDQKLFHKLHNDWINSGYNKSKTPSVDRKNDYKPYSLNNIRLITWIENKTKGDLDRKNGINNKQSKAVLQFDLNGNFIKEYYSLNYSSRETFVSNGDILRVCKGKRKTAGGFVWKYKDV